MSKAEWIIGAGRLREYVEKHELDKEVVNMRDEPKDFEGGSKGGTVWIVVGDDDVTLARYATHERAQEICRAIHDAYFAGDEKIILPEE